MNLDHDPRRWIVTGPSGRLVPSHIVVTVPCPGHTLGEPAHRQVFAFDDAAQQPRHRHLVCLDPVAARHAPQVEVQPLRVPAAVPPAHESQWQRRPPGPA